MEGIYHNAQIPFQNATLDSDEHFPPNAPPPSWMISWHGVLTYLGLNFFLKILLLAVRDMQMKATYFLHMFNHPL